MSSLTPEAVSPGGRLSLRGFEPQKVEQHKVVGC